MRYLVKAPAVLQTDLGKLSVTWQTTVEADNRQEASRLSAAKVQEEIDDKGKALLGITGMPTIILERRAG